MVEKQDEDIRKKLLMLWIDDLKLCSESFGTDNYNLAWSRFENDIVDVPGVAPFKQLLINKKKELLKMGDIELQEWSRRNPFESKTVEKEQIELEIKQRVNENLCNYMLGIITEKMF